MEQIAEAGLLFGHGARCALHACGLCREADGLGRSDAGPWAAEGRCAQAGNEPVAHMHHLHLTIERETGRAVLHHQPVDALRDVHMRCPAGLGGGLVGHLPIGHIGLGDVQFLGMLLQVGADYGADVLLRRGQGGDGGERHEQKTALEGGVLHWGGV